VQTTFRRGIPSKCLWLCASSGMEGPIALGAIRRSLTATTLPGGKLAFTFPYSPRKLPIVKTDRNVLQMLLQRGSHSTSAPAAHERREVARPFRF
jgi:hypothetical protein